MNRYKELTEQIKYKWTSYRNSKVKTQKSFEVDCIPIYLKTDLSKEYGVKEVERITITAEPTLLDNNFNLTDTGHVINTKAAQIVVDMFDACLKLRT